MTILMTACNARPGRNIKKICFAEQTCVTGRCKEGHISDTSVRSVDLQKVIMLPRMPGVKTAVFTWRIVACHEIFASVGKKADKKNTSLWSGMRALQAKVHRKSHQLT